MKKNVETGTPAATYSRLRLCPRISGQNGYQDAFPYRRIILLFQNGAIHLQQPLPMDLFATQNLESSVSASPSWCHPNHPTGHNRLRQIFRDHWEIWCYHRLEREVPANQLAYIQKTVQQLMLCRDPDGGYARYLCPSCNFEHRVPFPCKTRFCPSYVKSAALCGKVKVDNWVNDIAKDMLDVPHLHITLTRCRRNMQICPSYQRVPSAGQAAIASRISSGSRRK